MKQHCKALRVSASHATIPRSEVTTPRLTPGTQSLMGYQRHGCKKKCLNFSALLRI
ncbi:hypothetical protein E2C01_064392 [Portunus trituberculatus]|uniref:Uncharacterized protein n=1 Tax=Portunus trituberculatus TaxID=210409 RepID=A0A5B7HIY6_PORTR|nr:hypothetical protein [Portunus trituberculatus]